MADWPAMLRDVESCCDAAACLDLAGCPVYAAGHETPEAIRPREEFAYTSARLDLHLRPTLGDRWQGRGAAMVFNPTLLESHFGPDCLSLAVRCVGLHELAHVVAEYLPGIQTDLAVEPSDLETESRLLAKVLSKTYPADLLELTCLRHHHPRTFGRVALHLSHRAIAAGFDAPASLVWHPAIYAVHVYREALGDEPRRLSGLPIREVLTIDPPAAYLERCTEFDLHAAKLATQFEKEAT